jgi:hypothetical protein
MSRKGLMPEDAKEAIGHGVRAGSDARIIMGDDEGALLRLWREKRGEVEPEELSDNLIVQLGLVSGIDGCVIQRGGSSRRLERSARLIPAE